MRGLAGAVKKLNQAGSRDMSAADAAQLQGAPKLLVSRLAEGVVFEPRDTEVDTLTAPGEPWEARVETGAKLRSGNPREAHGHWRPEYDRPDPIDLVMASNQGRVPELIPLRMARMAASPFAFLRGAAVVMAWDLSRTPRMGLDVVIDGDCHVDNLTKPPSAPGNGTSSASPPASTSRAAPTG